MMLKKNSQFPPDVEEEEEKRKVVCNWFLRKVKEQGGWTIGFGNRIQNVSKTSGIGKNRKVLHFRSVSS